MSKSFRFSLEAALTQRRAQETSARRELARTLHDYAAATASEQALRQARTHAAGWNGASDAAFDGPARMSALYYLDRCAEAIRRQHGIVEQWEMQVEQRRAGVVDASRRRRALERLRERRLDDYNRDAQRRLDAQIDEMATLRYVRRDSDGESDDAD